jgi:hypothetical protein
MLANISAQEKAMELTLPASKYSYFHLCMNHTTFGSNVRSSQ